MNAPTSALRATIVTPDQALPIRLFDMDAKVLLTTEATGGTVSVVLGNLKPGDGPPDHVNFNQDEMFLILEGTCEFGAGDQTTTCGPGTIVFVPRNVVHRFKNVGDTTARVLEWSVPGGTGSLLQSDLRPRRPRRLHPRAGDGDRQEVRHELPRRALSNARRDFIRSNFLVNIGYGDRSKLLPRRPRLAFEQAVQVL